MRFSNVNIIIKIVYLNIILFLICSFLIVVDFIFQSNIYSVIENFYLPANKNQLINKPWSIFTYMFFHNGIFHLCFNMLALYWIYNMSINFFTNKQFIICYLLGGISGGLLFIIAFNNLSIFETMKNDPLIGSSAAIISIITAIATFKPNHLISLPVLGFIKLKYIIITLIILSIISIPSENSGGNIAHIGGAIFGYLYIKKTKNKPVDTSNNFILLLLNFFTNKKNRNIKKRVKSDYDFNAEKFNKKKNIDLILEKISKSGYESLSKKEKSILFNSSKEKN